MNNNARIISVVIPTYNRMAMLQRTLKVRVVNARAARPTCSR